MKHAITLESADVLKYIEDMLALRGIRPAVPILFRVKPRKRGMPQGAPEYEAVIECEEIPPLEACPCCGRSRKDEPKVVQASPAPTVAPPSAPSTDVPPADNVTRLPVTLDPAETVHLDEDLGESLEPPDLSGALGRPVGNDDAEDPSGMRGLLAQSKMLERQKRKELEERRRKAPKLMKGESFDPPK